MSVILDDQPVKSNVYKERAFFVGSFLGGPLVAGYFFAQNFKALGEEHKVKSTWLITIISTIVIFGLAIFIPENFPNIIFPIAYAGVATVIFKKYQESEVLAHVESGGNYHGWGRVILATVISLLIIVAVAMVAFVFADIFAVME